MRRLYPLAVVLIFAGAAVAILAYGIHVGVALVGAGICAAGGILATITCAADPTTGPGGDDVGATGEGE